MDNDDMLRKVDQANLLHPPNAIAEFVERLTDGVPPLRCDANASNERRAVPRFCVAAIAKIQTLDENLKLCGEPYNVMTRDISATGVGIHDFRPIDAKYLAMDLTTPLGDELKVAVEVTRCQPSGAAFQIGGRFVTKPIAADMPLAE